MMNYKSVYQRIRWMPLTEMCLTMCILKPVQYIKCIYAYIYSTWFDFEALGHKRQTVHVFNQFPIYKSACNKRMYQPNTKKCHVDQLIDSSKLKYIAICWEIYLFFLYKW